MTTTPTDRRAAQPRHSPSNRPGALDPRCRVGRVLCIDKSSSTLRFVVDGQVRQTLDARFGASGTPTREGVFHVYLKSADHVSKLYGSAMPFAMFFVRRAGRALLVGLRRGRVRRGLARLRQHP